MERGTGAAVDISVIVPSYRAAGTIERCLAALRDQRTNASFEVLVAASGVDETADRVRSLFPEVRLLHFPDRKFAGDARNLAAAEARGDLLAFIDADCIAAADWVETINRAHREQLDVIGGVVANADPASLAGRAYYFTEFHRWLPGTAAGFVDEIPACCLSMKRSAFERYGPFIEGTYCSDTVFHWRMADSGQRPYLNPALRVAHLSPNGLRQIISHAAYHGRSFGRMRVHERRISRGSSLLRAAASLLLPFVLFARAVRNVAASRQYRREFLTASPLVLLTMAGWSLGEARAYMAGAR